MLYLLGMGVGFHLGTLLAYPGIFVLVLMARRRRLPLEDLFGISVGLGLFFATTVFKDGFVLWSLLTIYALFVLYRSARGHHFMLIGSGVFILGLSVHIYLYIRAGQMPAINQTQPDNFAALMSVLRREQYPPIDPFVRRADLWWQIKYYYGYLMDQFAFVGGAGTMLSRTATFLGPIFLGLLGVIHGLWRARHWTVMLLVNYLINADLLNLYLNFSDHEVRDRDYFFATAFLFFAVFIGVGAAALLRYMAGPLGKAFRELKEGRAPAAIRIGWPVRAAVVLLLAIAALPALAPDHPKWHEHDRTHDTIPREYAWNMLAGLDRDAILFTNGDNDTFPIWYLQYVEGFRTDVTVVNLSLINLPWYIHQLVDTEPKLDLSYTPGQIDQLRPVLYEDPRTGEQRVAYVKDYIVADAVEQAMDKRPIFFAVTIPHENMIRYYPLLRMEGLAFRLTRERGPNDMPSVDSDRLLANFYGVYDFTGLLSGDVDARRSLFAELNGLPAGLGSERPVSPSDAAAAVNYEELLPLLGEPRDDVWINKTAGNLLGNYPAALIRAGYDNLTLAQAVAEDEAARYDAHLEKALASFELASLIDPTFPMVTDIYPLVLVEKNRSTDAIEFLDSISGRIPPQDEKKSIMQVASAMNSVGEEALTAQWMDRRIAAEPGEKFYYQVMFRAARSRGDVEACRRIHDNWTAVSGERDAEMTALIAEMEAAGNPADPGRQDGGGAR